MMLLPAVYQKYSVHALPYKEAWSLQLIQAGKIFVGDMIAIKLVHCSYLGIFLNVWRNGGCWHVTIISPQL